MVTFLFLIVAIMALISLGYVSAGGSSVELREQRFKLVKDARVILDKAKAEDRDLTSEESAQYDRIMDDADKAKANIDRVEKLERVEAEAGAPLDRQSNPLDSENRSRARGGDGSTASDARVRAAYVRYLQEGIILPEMRDSILGTDAKGGYLVLPVQISGDIIKTIDAVTFMRRICTSRKLTHAKALRIRKVTTRMADADWTTEVQAVTEDTTMALGVRDLTPTLLSKLCTASLRLLMASADAESLIREEMAYKFGITEEKGFLTGTGSGQPLGIFTASASGISTGRDVAAASATTVVGDDLINAKYTLRSGYLNDPSLAWVLHRDLLKIVRKLKDSTGQYLWSPSLSAGEPDRLFDIPFYLSEYAPNTFTTGLYVAVLGAFRYYTIVEVADFMIQRLVELYAAVNEVGFIGRMWVDGAPIMEEAFVRLKLA